MTPSSEVTGGAAPALPQDRLPAGHPGVREGRVGVLLVNLGTPDGTDAPAVRRYLSEFLSDRRVVDYPRAVWMPVLHGIILRTRPAKTGAAYAKIWRETSNESPLRYFTRAQAEAVAARVPGAHVDWAMRYGRPGIPERLDAMRAAGCDRILIVPLYPQYSATTTGTVGDAVARYAMEATWQPSFRAMPPFYDEPSYVEALAQSARKHVGDAERLILSFHGLPQRYFRAGDPYHCHCQKTARLLREAMGWDEAFAPIGFQSKFGPEKWLEPSTESLVQKAGADGIKRLAVMAPAFVSDCIETLEEIGIGLAETYLEAGGESLRSIPCLNDDDAFLDAMAGLVRRELGGWVAA